ncbi:MAG: hypothetical protein Q4P06_04845 [Actinomycetaceae bacterium]|nr:hypothetical protein [Actinomycetaceae bacterium]
MTDRKTLKVAEGDSVTCQIANHPAPKVKVVKTASVPEEGNTHIGKKVAVSTEKPMEMKYTVTVTNHGKQATDTGAIIDYFKVPEGLKWASSNGVETKATVTFNAGQTKAKATELNQKGESNVALKREFSQTDFANGAVLAHRVKELPAKASVTFEIIIPVMPDLEKSSVLGTVTGKTKFDANRDALAKCETITSKDKNHPDYKLTNSNSGVPNMVDLDGEDTTYATHWEADNTACIRIENELPKLPGLPLTGGTSRTAFLIAGMLIVSAGAVGPLQRLRKRTTSNTN